MLIAEIGWRYSVDLDKGLKKVYESSLTNKLKDIGFRSVSRHAFEQVDICEVTETMKEVVGFKRKLTFDTTKPDGAPRKLIDISSLSNISRNYSASLRDGLSKTYKWYLNKENQ